MKRPRRRSDHTEAVSDTVSTYTPILSNCIGKSPTFTTVQTITDNKKAYLQKCLDEKIAPYMDANWRQELLKTSPFKLNQSSDHSRAFIKALFFNQDVLWLGGVYDSGKPRHAANFRTLEDWLQAPVLPPRIAAGTFNGESCSRSMQAVRLAPYVIIESDKMSGEDPITEEEKETNKRLFAAFIGYASSELGLTLRAVIDTGNKSLHSWWDCMSEHQMDCLVHMAESFNLDLGLIQKCAAAPLRLPGCIHDKTTRRAELLYLHPYFKSHE
jgi:hypothetical protein